MGKQIVNLPVAHQNSRWGKKQTKDEILQCFGERRQNNMTIILSNGKTNCSPSISKITAHGEWLKHYKIKTPPLQTQNGIVVSVREIAEVLADSSERQCRASLERTNVTYVQQIEDDTQENFGQLPKCCNKH